MYDLGFFVFMDEAERRENENADTVRSAGNEADTEQNEPHKTTNED